MNIIFYNRNLIEKLHELKEETSSKVFRSIELLEEFGNTLRMPHSKKITSKLFELRTKGQEEIRLIYTFHKNSAVLLHVFKKKSQKAPRKEIMTAEAKLRSLN